jgi:chemotaxis protein MotB
MAKTEWEELKKRLEFSERRRAFLQKRLSKGSIEEDSTLWSFVDLMTLLLILFILFYSHALARKGSTDNPSSPQPQTSVAQSLQIQNMPVTSEPVAYNQDEPKRDASKTEQEDQDESLTEEEDQDESLTEEENQDESLTEEESQDESLEQLQQQVLQTVSKEVQNDFSIHWNQKRLVLVLGERVAFDVGEANLLPDFQPTLKRIAGFISSQEGYKIAVAGHTDDAPIATTQFPSNWELSAIRAVNVAKFMILNGVSPHRVSIEGYSAYRPIHANTTSQNKQANRRVEITLIKQPANEKTAENKGAQSAIDASMKHTKAANLSAYLNKRPPAAPEYPILNNLP